MSKSRDIADSAATINYIDNVTSDVQSQLNAKVETLGDLGVTATATELNYTDGVTSAIQAQLNAKPDNLSDLGVTATTTELNYVDGVTSAVQTQLDGKEPADATILKDADIGSTVQAYDANLNGFVGTFTLPTTDGSADQFLQTNGSGTLSFADVSGGGLTLLGSLSVASAQSYTFNLPSNWWTGTYKYIKAIYNFTYQSGDPSSGSAGGFFRIGSATSNYRYAGQYGGTNNSNSQTEGRFIISSGSADNQKGQAILDIYTDGTNTAVHVQSSGAVANFNGFVNNHVPTTPTSFIVYQPYTGSERYRYEGTVKFYGVN